VKGISNYIAAIITVSMIFTSVAFLISLTLRQAKLSTDAMNTMAEIAERAREKLGVSYILLDDYHVKVTMTNLGDIDIILSYIIITYNDLSVQKISMNNLAIPVGEVYTYVLNLNKSFGNVSSIKILTYRGNVFDLFATAYKPYTLTALVNREYINSSVSFKLRIIVENNIPSTITMDPKTVKIYFYNHTTGDNITSYFTITSYFPNTTTLDSGEKTIFVYQISYSGGLKGYVDIVVIVSGVDDYGNSIDQTLMEKTIFYVS